MTVKPIRPDEVVEKKKESIPDTVFEAFNELIIENYSNNQSVVRQDDVVDLMVRKGISRADIIPKGYLDVEPIYRKEGWKVVYDKPAYNETYSATFTFSKV